jgi:topoisomerase IV subunit A
MSTEEKDKLENQEETDLNQPSTEDTEISADHKLKHLPGKYKDWFLDYASYVILERAVPHVNDGLKPVQRRILHSMKRLDDGRYNKVANLIGHTMQFHPHGDASIGDALVQLGQKNLLIDTQGNWGNILTGDGAAAPRYIEARLSKFATEVVFNPKTTFWRQSYDGRNKEPVTLPVKFPLLLTQGVEGIAVGLASKILPHNFNELIDASIAFLKGNDFEILPDFPTGGMADFSRYNNGLRGGSVKVRARIEKLDKKTLCITELPFGKNTSSLIESILKANDKGKIKIKKIDDNTADKVEIVIHLASGVSSDKTIDALYAFSDCELSISPNSCVIEDEKPKFLAVSEILKINTDNTLNLLKRELEIRKAELEEDWHFSSLEKIFIENRIYHRIEECETYEAIIETIDKGLEPFKKLLKREVTRDDIIRLTEIKIKRISRYDSFRADDHITKIEEEIEQINYHLANIVPYTIKYYQDIKKKFGKGRERKTEIRSFDTIIATKVAVANEKLYVNRKEGFIGTSLKKDDFLCECSDIDDIIIFRRDGKYLITKVSDKSFVGKDILYAAVFKPNDERTIYNLVYKDGRAGSAYMKRFFVKGITRDKEYDITKGTASSRIMYFTANPNGEAEIIKVLLKPKPKLRRLNFEMDFGELSIKGRGSMGNILSKYDIHRISFKEKGLSTLGGRKIWFDEDVFRINGDGRGKFLGEFLPEDRILFVSKRGYYRLTSFDLANHYEDDLLIIEKYVPNKIHSVVHFDGDQLQYYLKRFEFEVTDRNSYFINEDSPESKLVSISDDYYSRVLVRFGGAHREKEDLEIDCDEFIGIKSYKARGKRITTFEVKKFEWLEVLRKLESEKEPPKDDETDENGQKGSDEEMVVPGEISIAPKEETPMIKVKAITEEPTETVVTEAKDEAKSDADLKKIIRQKKDAEPATPVRKLPKKMVDKKEAAVKIEKEKTAGKTGVKTQKSKATVKPATKVKSKVEEASKTEDKASSTKKKVPLKKSKLKVVSKAKKEKPEAIQDVDFEIEDARNKEEKSSDKSDKEGGGGQMSLF